LRHRGRRRSALVGILVLALVEAGSGDSLRAVSVLGVVLLDVLGQGRLAAEADGQWGKVSSRSTRCGEKDARLEAVLDGALVRTLAGVDLRKEGSVSGESNRKGTRRKRTRR
jgi:hypothetical protein